MRRNPLTIAALALVVCGVPVAVAGPATARAETITGKTYTTYTVPAGTHDVDYSTAPSTAVTQARPCSP